METLKLNVVSLLGAERMLYARWCRVRKQVSPVGRMGTGEIRSTFIYVLPLERETVEEIMLKTLVLLKKQ